MTKSDKSKHNICIAAIKRHTIEPYNFKWTKFYETSSEFNNKGLLTELANDELIICSTVIDADNYSVLTTQKLVTTENGKTSFGNITGALRETYGEFKGSGDTTFTLGEVILQNGSRIKYFTETGKASMVMIYGINTLMGMGD